MAIQSPADLSTALLALTGGLLAAAVAWALLILALSSWQQTYRWALAITPRLLRTVLFTGVSGAVALGPIRAMADDLDGLPLPDRPVTSTIAEQRTRMVSAGDSLWAIAADELGAQSSAAMIAAETHRWHLRNRAVIGNNPDLIQPGQILYPPNAAEESR